MKAMTASVSMWKHIQCGNCEQWFAVEDDSKLKYFCAHCGQENEVKPSEPPDMAIK
jgi:rRNA maturation endonuclease Nob1